MDGNLDPPSLWDAGFALAPFASCDFRCTQISGYIIHQFPSERLGHLPMIGQIVQDVKDDMSKDFAALGWHGCPMATWGREQEFNESYIARVKRLREERGWTSEQMATALGIPPERYRKYEYRTPLPHYLVEQFAAIVDRDTSYVLTGKRSERPMRVVRTGTDS